MQVYCYRYVWTTKDVKDKVNFKIVSDTLDGLKLFEEKLLSLPDLDNVGREYICEYDCSKFGVFDDLKNI